MEEANDYSRAIVEPEVKTAAGLRCASLLSTLFGGPSYQQQLAKPAQTGPTAKRGYPSTSLSSYPRTTALEVVASAAV